MSTNYYMIIKDKDFAEKFFPECEFEEDCLVHIGKRSGGWKPLFEAHPKAYNSVQEMIKFLEKNDTILVKTEYEEVLTVNELVSELVYWGSNVIPKRFSINEYGELIHDKNGPIRTPIDHVEYSKIVKSWMDIKYWHDEDGYDFTDRPFS